MSPAPLHTGYRDSSSGGNVADSHPKPMTISRPTISRMQRCSRHNWSRAAGRDPSEALRATVGPQDRSEPALGAQWRHRMKNIQKYFSQQNARPSAPITDSVAIIIVVLPYREYTWGRYLVRWRGSNRHRELVSWEYEHGDRRVTISIQQGFVFWLSDRPNIFLYEIV